MARQFSRFKISLRAILLPSIGNIVFLSVFSILIFRSENGLLNDGDTGYHIKTGQVILQTWSIPAHDIYSFHSPPLSWTAHEWFAEVIMGMTFNVSGLTGVIVLFAFLLALSHWLLYQTLRNNSDDLILCIIITILATATSSTHWLARPHVFSILFTVIWCYCLRRFQHTNHQRILYYLPLVMLFWVNLHGGFILGLVLLTVYLLGDCVDFILARPEVSKSSCARAKSLCFTLGACLAASFLNPYGFEIFVFPFRVTSDRFVMDHVIEFLSPNFHEPLAFKYMLLILIGALAFSRSALRLVDSSLVVLLSYMSLYSARHVSLFAVVLAPVLLKTTIGIIKRMPDRLLEWYHTRSLNLRAVDSSVTGYFWPALGVISVVTLVIAGRINYQFDGRKFPVKAVEFLKRERIAGTMFNNDEFGDYLIFAAWPDYRVFMDGRSDMYGEKFGRDYLRVAGLEPGWKGILKKYDIDWVIFDTESVLTNALRDQKDWQSIYSDQVATIFVRKDPKFASVLAKYPRISLATR